MQLRVNRTVFNVILQGVDVKSATPEKIAQAIIDHDPVLANADVKQVAKCVEVYLGENKP
tara:strand:- start:519 stop:698 length:180 start_codon:yes stop_codon:yes gene_type:complete